MMLHEVFRLVRPRQGTKNLAVFAGLIFSGQLFDASLALRSGFAFVALNLVTGGLYALNDAADAERDRLHPIKCNRPVASGAVSKIQARVIGCSLVVTGLMLSAALGRGFLLCAAGYIGLQLLYGALFKHIAIVDMLTIAFGFVLRAVAGAAVINVPVSPWLVLCTGLLALFLATSKRRHELLLLCDGSSDHRPVLSEYSAELLDSFMVTLSAATITSYALYTFFEARAPYYSMMFTIPFVIYGVLRYQSLVLMGGRGGRPEEVLLGDRPIMIAVVLWVSSAIVAIYILPNIL